MNRREVIALIAGAALSRSILEARSADRVRKVAVLMAIGENDPEGQARVAAFTQALEEIGWTEGKNIYVEWRWSAGQPDRLKQEASEIVLRRPDVIVAVGTPGLQAVRETFASDSLRRGGFAFHTGRYRKSRTFLPNPCAHMPQMYTPAPGPPRCRRGGGW